MQCEGNIQPKYEEGDIEQNISQTKDPHGSSPTPPYTSTASNDRLGEIDEVEADATKCGTIFNLIVNTCTLILLILVFPFVLIYRIFTFSLTGNSKNPFKPKSQPDYPETKGVYRKMQEFLPAKYKFRRLYFVTSCRVGCLALFWLVVNLCVPKLTNIMLLGSFLWKWSLLVTLVSFGWPCTCTAVGYFGPVPLLMFVDQTHLVHYYFYGLMASVMSLVCFTWVLLAWMFYFRLDLLHNPNSRPIEKYATWTLVSLLVGSILWVMKDLVLLRWKTKAIYKRFKARVLMAGFQLFFLSKIIDGLWIPALLPWRYKDKDGKWVVVMDDREFRRLLGSGGDENDNDITSLKRRSIQAYMLSKHLSMLEMQMTTERVMDLAKVAQREDDDVFDIIRRYHQNIAANNESDEYVIANAIRKLIDNDEAELLFAQLKAEFPSKKINQALFLKWIVDAHKNCLSLGYTLIDAYAVISVLDKVLTCCLVVVVVVLWLLLTDLATTKMLVVIASPFLALTFMFGDTCKTFFQGVIFSFVTHPFDVGDRCVIDGVEVEVKRISILTTTCLKIGTKEKMLYPNSSLATKLIFNLEAKPDPADVIELILSSSTKSKQLVHLRNSVRNFIGDEDQRKFYEKSCRVRLKEIGNNIKVSIYFKHTLNVQDATHSQFVEEKNRRRSKFFKKIKQFLEDLNIKVAAP